MIELFENQFASYHSRYQIIGSQITLISAVAAPEGVQRLKSENPGTHLIIAQVDDKLDEHKYRTEYLPWLNGWWDRISEWPGKQ